MKNEVSTAKMVREVFFASSTSTGSYFPLQYNNNIINIINNKLNSQFCGWYLAS